MNINKESVKKLEKGKKYFLIDICQYRINIYKKNNTFSDKYVRKNLKIYLYKIYVEFKSYKIQLFS